VAVLLAVSLTAVACGGDDDDTSSPDETTGTTGGAAEPAPPTGELDNAGGGPLADLAADSDLTGPEGSGLDRGITDDSVKVGCVYTTDAFPGFEKGLEARFERANRDGGVAGRTIELVPCKDDAADVPTNVQATQQLIDEDEIFALFSLSNNILNGSTDYMSENEVPYYGWGFNPGFCGTRWGFGWNGCLAGNALDESVVDHAAISGNLADAVIASSGMDADEVKVAIQVENSASGAIGLAQFETIFEDRGADVVYAEKDYPENAAGADVTPYTQAMIAADPNIVLLTTPFAEVPRLVAGLRAGGYEGIIVDFQNYIPGLLESSPQLAETLDGEYVNTQIVPQEEGTPWVEQTRDDLVAIGEEPFVTLAGAMGYAEAELFVEQLEAIGEDLDTATFDQVVNSGDFSSYTELEGGPGPLLWPAAHLLPADCAAVVRIEGTSYEVVTPFRCYSSMKVF